MWVFSPAFPPDWAVVAPRAPHALESGGYSWTQTAGRPTHSELEPAVRTLRDFLPAAATSSGGDPGKIILVGFSQGAAVVLSALLLGVPAQAGVVLAGFLPEGAAGSLRGTPIFWAHGRRDRDVPYAEAQADVERLQRMEARVEFCETDVDHRVGAACMRALNRWLASLPVPPKHRPSDVP
jgi:predicted esterase